MDELKFVVKCLLFACLLFALSQYRMDNGITVEAYVRSHLVSSPVADFVNQSARGGVKLIYKASDEISNYISGRRPIHSAAQSKSARDRVAQAQKEQVDTEDDIDLK